MKCYDIGDASFIGLDCKSGNVTACNSGINDRCRLPDCEGVLILSEEESQCGLDCDPNPVSGTRRWTCWISQATDLNRLYVIQIRNKLFKV